MKHFFLELQSVQVHLIRFRQETSTTQGRAQCRALELIASDFAALATETQKRAKIKIYLVDQIPLARNGRRFPARAFKTSMASVYGWGSHRVCDYGDVIAESNWIGDTRCFWVAGENSDLLREVIYSIVLSSLGEELDTRGFHRVHALGFEYQEKRALMIGASGAGKSTLACLLLDGKINSRLFSDESPLLRAAAIYPFALRLALFPEVAERLNLKDGVPFQRKIHRLKNLFRFPNESMAEPGSVDYIFVARPHQRYPNVTLLSRRVAAWELLKTMVIGLGLAQMAEWMLRLDAIPRIIWIASSRTLGVVRLLRGQTGLYVFDLCEDARSNVDFLLRFLTAIETLSRAESSSPNEVLRMKILFRL